MKELGVMTQIYIFWMKSYIIDYKQFMKHHVYTQVHT